MHGEQVAFFAVHIFSEVGYGVGYPTFVSKIVLLPEM
jgi:hypothetical protein